MFDVHPSHQSWCRAFGTGLTGPVLVLLPCFSSKSSSQSMGNSQPDAAMQPTCPKRHYHASLAQRSWRDSQPFPRSWMAMAGGHGVLDGTK